MIIDSSPSFLFLKMLKSQQYLLFYIFLTILCEVEGKKRGGAGGGGSGETDSGKPSTAYVYVLVAFFGGVIISVYIWVCISSCRLHKQEQSFKSEDKHCTIIVRQFVHKSMNLKAEVQRQGHNYDLLEEPIFVKYQCQYKEYGRQKQTLYELTLDEGGLVKGKTNNDDRICQVVGFYSKKGREFTMMLVETCEQVQLEPQTNNFQPTSVEDLVTRMPFYTITRFTGNCDKSSEDGICAVPKTLTGEYGSTTRRRGGCTVYLQEPIFEEV
eukprot:TRINITY_DN24010_c0_g2_i3.p1 TRINITY_DN24010_c0_g2~~TRINITY_DN24010_c0_g2_i3.p1  ORF type:complete len:269 (-),score=17.90 TRINITY_DN24010_c0_g2_i3:170-976(-)